MCSLHFKESDFQTESKDTNKWRKESSDKVLKHKFLQQNSVPSVFPNLPQHFNIAIPEKRSESTSIKARFEKQDQANELANFEFLEADNISSFNDLREKLESDPPKDTLKLETEDKLTFYVIKEDEAGQPFVSYSLVIRQDLTFTLWCSKIEVSQTKVAHLCKDKKVNSCSGVHNILTVLKNMSEEKILPPTNTIEYCISLLEKVIPDLEEEQSKKVGFLNEQLQLSILHKHGRRYSPGLLACTALWKNTSPALYKQIQQEGVLTLPGPRHLDSLTSGFKVEGGKVDGGLSESTKQYLKVRMIH